MAVAYSNETTQTATSGTSLVITVPSGVTNGDLLVLAINGGSGQSAFTATGWTTMIATYTDANDTAGAVFYRIASSEPANYTVSWTTATGDCVASMKHFTGSATTSPIRASRNDGAGVTGASFATTALAGVQATDMTVQIAQMGDDVGSTTFTVTEPSGVWTSIDNLITVRPKFQGAVWATGSQSGATWTSSSASAFWNVITFAIIAAAGPSPQRTPPNPARICSSNFL